MQIEVKRFEFGTNYTISKMYINGTYECFVLEDKVRVPFVKIPGQTAIPAGTYEVTIDYSNRFGKDMPHVLNVPDFDGIRIHTGNTDKDTEGCLLLGQNWGGNDFISNSVLAFNHFFPQLQKAIVDKETVILVIG